MNKIILYKYAARQLSRFVTTSTPQVQANHMLETVKAVDMFVLLWREIHYRTAGFARPLFSLQMIKARMGKV